MSNLNGHPDFYENALEQCLKALDQGQTPEQAIASFPALKAELLPALEAAFALQRSARQLPVSSQRKIAGLKLFLEEARGLNAERSAQAPPPVPVFKKLRQPLYAGFLKVARSGMAAAILVPLVLFSGSAVMAAEDSLPGEPLYVVKRAVEGASVVLATSPERKAEKYVEQARVRASEAQELQRRGLATEDQLRRLASSAEQSLGESRAQINRLPESQRQSRQSGLASEMLSLSQEIKEMERLADMAPTQTDLTQTTAPIVLTATTRVQASTSNNTVRTTPGITSATAPPLPGTTGRSTTAPLPVTTTPLPVTSSLPTLTTSPAPALLLPQPVSPPSQTAVEPPVVNNTFSTGDTAPATEVTVSQGEAPPSNAPGIEPALSDTLTEALRSSGTLQGSARILSRTSEQVDPVTVMETVVIENADGSTQTVIMVTVLTTEEEPGR